MKNCCIAAIGLLALLAVASCAPSLEPAQHTETATTATTAVATPTAETSTPTAAPEVPTPTPLSSNNVAASGEVIPSSGQESAHLAVDGDLESLWNSGRIPLGWIRIALDGQHLVNRVEMVVAQAPPGPTTHELWLGDSSGTRALYKRLISEHTEDGQTLAVSVDPPRNITEVYIRTVQSPSWVAWRELRVFGDPSGDAPPPAFKLSKIADGLNLPVQLRNAGDGSGRLFVIEQAGRIRILRKDAASNSGAAWSVDETPFLDISKSVSCCGEQGLFDLAFPPDYSVKQYFYVSYTNRDGHTVIGRYETTPDSDSADPNSEEVILTIDQPHDTHNGGRLLFSPNDGYLYIGSGDGGAPAFNDPDNHGQNPSILLGKILRIDVESGVKPYAIPASNPFLQVEGYRGEIWAYGLRNPWGFAFDRQTGDLYIPDVGNITQEEVNFQPAASTGGENYGWRITEGSICFEQWGCVKGEPCTVEHWICSAEGQTQPVAEYNHELGCAIVGGAVYRGSSLPDLQGVFLYADFCRGQVWGLKGGPQNKWQSPLLVNAAVPVSAIGEDEEGNVYVIGYQDGVISMITE